MPIAASSSAEPPNTDISSMLKRSREVDRVTTSSIERMSETGRPVTWRSTSWTCALTDSGGTLVRTTHATGVMRTLRALTASGTCGCGMYIFGPGSWLRPLSRTSPTTPMISRSGSSANSRITPRPMISRLPIGSSSLKPRLRQRLVDDDDRRRRLACRGR